jgi:hypothetical protein
VKLYVDDWRSAPSGWACARSVDEAIAILRQGTVTELSLDYDLGGAGTTGLQVLHWIESEIESGHMAMPLMTAHSGSVVGRRRLESQIEWLEQRFARGDES